MEYLPKWEMKAYANLWNAFKTRKFSHEQAVKILNMKKEIVSIIISDLRKFDWLGVSLDQKDSRKRLYELVDSSKAWKIILKELSEK